MTTIVIRNVPPTLAARLDEAAQGEGLSREEFLRRFLAAAFVEPHPFLAWLKTDRPGELHPQSCPECGQDMAELWFGVMSNRTLAGPVCAGCAVND